MIGVFASGPATLEGVTFASSPRKTLVPVREIANGLGLPFGKTKGGFILGGKPLDKQGPELADGARLIPLQSLGQYDVSVVWDAAHHRSKLYKGGKVLYVRRGEKRVYIDMTHQTLRGLQGTRTILRSPIGTGIEGKATPQGIFKVQGFRAKMLHSKLYQGAPMPYSVQIVGNIFVHGWPRVKGRPASHGCIHLPMTGPNPAKIFYDWADTGTPVIITGKWKG